MRRVAGLLAAGALLAACAEPPGPPVTVHFVGDILLDSKPGETIARGGDPFAPTQALLAAADLVVGNLECTIASQGRAENKLYTFRADPRVLGVLASHVGAVSLANNHSLDFGRAAFLESLSGLRKARLPFFGGGENLARAHEPLILERKGLKIALLGYDAFMPRSFEAGSDTPGVAWAEDEQILLDLRRARALGADVVLPFLHWGWENEPEPSAHQRELARRLIDAGADAVIGSHPHVTQGVELYRGKPIVYSLGNFVFDLNDVPDNQRGWVLELTLDRRGVARFATVSVRIDEAGTPVPELAAAGPCAERGSAEVRSCSDTR